MKDFQRATHPPHVIQMCTDGSGKLTTLDQDGVIWSFYDPELLRHMGHDPAHAGWYQMEYGDIYYGSMPKRPSIKLTTCPNCGELGTLDGEGYSHSGINTDTERTCEYTWKYSDTNEWFKRELVNA